MKLKHQENHLEVLKTDENQRHCFSIKNNGIKWDDIFKMLKENNCQPGILCPMKITFKNEDKTKKFTTSRHHTKRKEL